jgi:heme/copper-type cytochrome/quinol oxidase subunit 3
MSIERTVDLRGLPTYAFGHRTLMWWGTIAVMAIEGTVFAMAIVSYFYLRTRTVPWPPNAVPPDLLWGTVNTGIMLASLWPNQIVKHAAEHEQLRRARRWMIAALAFGVAFAAVRILEFGSLRVSWDTNAYGSITWTVMGLHTAHLVTDLFDSVVLLVLLYTGPITGRRFADVSENCLYWYFVVVSWLPIYGLIYFAPRVL